MSIHSIALLQWLKTYKSFRTLLKTYETRYMSSAGIFDLKLEAYRVNKTDLQLM